MLDSILAAGMYEVAHLALPEMPLPMEFPAALRPHAMPWEPFAIPAAIWG